MMTVAIFLTVCALKSGACQQIEPAGVRPPASFFACLGIDGQRVAREWNAEHPAYRVGAWSCSVGKRGGAA